MRFKDYLMHTGGARGRIVIKVFVDYHEKHYVMLSAGGLGLGVYMDSV